MTDFQNHPQFTHLIHSMLYKQSNKHDHSIIVTYIRMFENENNEATKAKLGEINKNN